MSKNTTNLSPAKKFNQISLQYPLTNVFVNTFPSLIPYATAIKELSFYPLSYNHSIQIISLDDGRILPSTSSQNCHHYRLSRTESITASTNTILYACQYQSHTFNVHNICMLWILNISFFLSRQDVIWIFEIKNKHIHGDIDIYFYFFLISSWDIANASKQKR